MPTNHIRLKKVAEILGVHEQSIRDWVREGLFPPPLQLTSRPSGPVCWPQSQVEQWLAARPRGFGRRREGTKRYQDAQQAAKGNGAGSVSPRGETGDQNGNTAVAAPAKVYGFRRGDSG